ncbi:hypothetical protein [Legionella sp. WA2022007384]
MRLTDSDITLNSAVPKEAIVVFDTNKTDIGLLADLMPPHQEIHTIIMI